MKLTSLFERKVDGGSEPYVDKICKVLFGQGSGAVSDAKRKGNFHGVANAKSVITDQDGNHLNLTFDNSTGSGEFELNSLTPLHIVKGSDLDLEIAKLHAEHDVKSSKKLGYIKKGSDLVLREVHFGKVIDENAINFVMDLIVNLKHAKKKVKESVGCEAYGKCPECGEYGVVTEKRIDGDSICANKHKFKRPKSK